MTDLLIVIPFTSDYAHMAQSLQGQLNDAGYGASCAYYPSKGSWVANTLFKPQMAEIAWIRHGPDRPLWIMDADLDIKQPDRLPELWMRVGFSDVAIHIHEEPEDFRKMDQLCSAGVVGFAPTPSGRAALAWWAQACRQHKPGANGWRYPEQALLYRIVEMEEHGEAPWGVNGIPLAFNARPFSADQREGMWDMKDEDIVISHTPASRTMKGIVNG